MPETKAEPSSQAPEHPNPHHTHSLVLHSPLDFAEGERTQVELADDTVSSAPNSYGTRPGNHLRSGEAHKVPFFFFCGLLFKLGFREHPGALPVAAS